MLDQIKSKPKNSILFFTKRNFKLFETKNDLRKLISFYKQNGYRDVIIQSSYEYIEKKNYFNIIYSINEGDKYEFLNLTLNIENISLNVDQLNSIDNNFILYRDKFLLKNNSYGSNLYDKIKVLLTEELFDLGLKFFDIEISENVNNLFVNATVIVNKSLPMFVNQILINGNYRTLDEVYPT